MKTLHPLIDMSQRIRPHVAILRRIIHRSDPQGVQHDGKNSAIFFHIVSFSFYNSISIDLLLVLYSIKIDL